MNDRLQKIAPHDGIEPERGIVEHEQIRIGRQGQGQRNLGPLPIREAANLGRGRNAKMIEHLADEPIVPDGGKGRVHVEAAREAHGLGNAHAAVQRMPLGQIRNPPRGWLAADRDCLHSKASPGRRQAAPGPSTS